MQSTETGSSEERVKQFSYSSLTVVTPLSKYLALSLFILLPFLGAYVGFQIGSSYTAMMHTQVSSTTVLSDSDTRQQSWVAKNENIAIGERMSFEVSPYENSLYTLTLMDVYNQGFLSLEEYESSKTYHKTHVEKLSGRYTQVVFSAEGSVMVGVIYDEFTNSVVRLLGPGQLLMEHSLYKMLISSKEAPHVVMVTCAPARGCMPEVSIENMLTGERSLLYREVREGVKLAEACEVGCVGLLNVTLDNQVLVGAYQSRETDGDLIFADYFETILIDIPGAVYELE